MKFTVALLALAAAAVAAPAPAPEAAPEAAPDAAPDGGGYGKYAHYGKLYLYASLLSCTY